MVRRFQFQAVKNVPVIVTTMPGSPLLAAKFWANLCRQNWSSGSVFMVNSCLLDMTGLGAVGSWGGLRKVVAIIHLVHVWQSTVSDKPEDLTRK